MIHINLNMILYTHVEHSPTKTTHTNHQTERQTTPLSIHPPTHKKHNQARARTERVRLRRPRHVRTEEPVFGKVPNCKALATAYSYHALFTARYCQQLSDTESSYWLRFVVPKRRFTSRLGCEDAHRNDLECGQALTSGWSSFQDQNTGVSENDLLNHEMCEQQNGAMVTQPSPSENRKRPTEKTQTCPKTGWSSFRDHNTQRSFRTLRCTNHTMGLW